MLYVAYLVRRHQLESPEQTCALLYNNSVGLFCRNQMPPDAVASLVEWFTTNTTKLSQQCCAVPDDDYFGNVHANIKWALEACEAKGVAGLD
ncbi:hypothetical protein KSD_72520 [Ktedonobacter sp. SOSP1-85]|nr:hypothetical protein KSD_72520 [Ktedonobacter sp. SOSP1-85]